MKLKTINNLSQILGGMLGFVILIIFISGGIYLNTPSNWTLIIGFTLCILVILLTLKQHRVVTFYTDRVSFYGILKKEETIHLHSSKIKLNLMGGSSRIPLYSVSLRNGKEFIAEFKVNETEWEFEEFYHQTKEAGYHWIIHEGQKKARRRDYQLFLNRKNLMDQNRKM